MLTQGEKKEIENFTKTPTWGIFKKLFQEKREVVLDYMQKLDIDNQEERTKFKKTKDSLEAFKSLILEIENIGEEKKNQEDAENYNQEIDNFVNGVDK